MLIKEEITRDGFPVLRIKNKENKWIYIDSKYNKKRQIEKLISDLKIEYEENIIVIIGLESGAHVEQIATKYPNNKIIIVEPSIDIFNYYNSKIKNIQQHQNVHIIYFDDSFSFINKMISILGENRRIEIKKGIYSNYKNIYKDLTSKILHEISVFESFVNANANIFSIKKDEILLSFLKNLINISKSINLKKLENLFLGKTAIITAAGPSLQKSLPYLKEWNNKAVIISGCRELKLLLDNDVKTDFVCAIDMQEKVYSFVSQILQDKPLNLVLGETAYYKIARENKGRNMFVTNTFSSTMNKLFPEKYNKIPIGGSVAHLSLQLAKYLGCSRVVFLGQDLAYTDNKMHSEGASEIKNEGSYYSPESLFYVEGNKEEKILTDGTFNMFKIWIERFIKYNNQIKYINATEGGARIYGTEILALNEIEKDVLIEHNADERLKNFKETKNCELNLLSNKIVNIKKEIEKIEKLSLEAINMLQGGFVNPKRYKKIQEDFSKIKMSNELIGFEQYTYIDDIQKNNDFKINIGIDNQERKEKGLKKDIEIYKALHAASKNLNCKIEDVLKDIKNEKIKKENQ